MLVPVEMPLRPNEAVRLADLVVGHMEGRPLTDEARSRLAARLPGLELESIRPCVGALVRDPVHRNVYHMPVDGLSGPEPALLLLHMAPASAPSSALFPGALMVGRMRPASGRELVVNAVPFGPSDGRSIRTFAEQLDRAFLPRPQGAQPSIVVASQPPASGLPVAFEGFRQLLKSTAVNWAATAAPYEASVWAAIRAGWREGYSAVADRLRLDSESDRAALREQIHQSAGCTRFTFEVTAGLGAPAEAGAGQWLFELFARPFLIGDAAYTFADDEIAGLARKYGRGLELCEELFDFVRQTRIASGLGRAFDFALALDRAAAPTTPQELIFCLHWLRTRGRPAQLVAPALDIATAPELAAVTRYFNATLSVETAVSDELLETVRRAAAGRISLTVALSTLPDPRYIVRLASLLRG